MDSGSGDSDLIIQQEEWIPHDSFYQLNLSTRISLVLVLSMSFIIGIGIRFHFVSFCFIYAPKGRPVNILMGIEQSVAFVSTAIFQVLVLASMTTRISINDLFGSRSCDVFLIALTITWINRIFSGITLAVFRVLSTKSMKLTYQIIGKFCLMWFLVVLAALAATIHFSFWMKGLFASGDVVAYELCRNQNKEMADIFNLYKGNVNEALKIDGLRQMKTTTKINLLIHLTEFGLYWYLIRGLIQHDKSMASILGWDTVRQRNRKNTLTLGGQMLCFMLDIVVLILFKVFRSPKLAMIPRAYFPLTMCIGSAASATFRLLASPELQRHLKQKYLKH